MALVYTDTPAQGSESSTDVDALLNEMRDVCVAGGMTEKSGVYSTSTFFHQLFDPTDGIWISIAGVKYQFYTVTPPSPPIVGVPTGATVGESFVNLQTVVNSVDANFWCSSIYFNPLPTPPDSGYELGFRSKQRGTAGNTIALVASSASFGRFSSNLNGGWRVQTSDQHPELLMGRILMVRNPVTFGIGTMTINMATALEDFVTEVINPDTTGGIVYQVLAGQYNMAMYAPGSETINQSFIAQVPSVPSFLKPIRISAVTNQSPVRVTTAAAHGLETGDTVYINDCQDSVIIANGTLALPCVLTLSIQPWADGDIIECTGTNSGSDIDGIWEAANVTNGANGTMELVWSVPQTAVTGGNVTGPRTSTNGQWTVTVLNATQFTLDGSDGTGSGIHVANTGIVARTASTLPNVPMQISRLLFLGGSLGATNLRTRLYNQSTSQAVVINATSYGLSNSNGNPRFLLPGLTQIPALWSNDCAILSEPWLCAGPNGTTSDARVICELWDAFLVTQDNPLDSTTVFDSKNWVQFGRATTAVAGATNGALWLRTP